MLAFQIEKLRSKISERHLQLASLGLLTALLAWWVVSGYLAADMTFFAGLLLAPVVVVLRGGASSGWRWAVLAAVSMLAGWFVPARTLHFFALAFTALFVVERRFGRLNELPALLVFVMSALMKNWATVFGFPVRLALSGWAASALAAMGFDAHAEGNIIVFEGRECSVDPACMGLSMVQMSLLFALAVVAIFERRGAIFQKTDFQKNTVFQPQKLPFGWVVFALLPAVLLLNVGYNLLRIMLLTLMDWMPGSVMHEVGGLVGLALYVFLPTWFLVKMLFKFFAKPLPAAAENRVPIFQKTAAAVQILLCLALLQIAFFETTRTLGRSGETFPRLSLSLPGENLERKTLAHGVEQFRNDAVLVYVKPIRGFFSSEHTPLICWEGSGYRFSESGQKRLPGGREIFTGLLKKDNGERLHTAWWYANAETETLSQWRWRWLDLRGSEPFFLVNVSAASEAVLEDKIGRLVFDFKK